MLLDRQWKLTVRDSSLVRGRIIQVSYPSPLHEPPAQHPAFRLGHRRVLFIFVGLLLKHPSWGLQTLQGHRCQHRTVSCCGGQQE